MKKYLKTMFLFFGFIFSFLAIGSYSAFAEERIPVASYDASIGDDQSIMIHIYVNETEPTEYDMHISGEGMMKNFDYDIPWITTDGTNELLYNITSVTIDNRITSIGSGSLAFLNARVVDIPNSVTSIGEFAFAYIKAETINIPNSVISIADGAFAKSSIISINVPASVITIGDGIFAFTESLTSVTGMEGLTYIGENMFEGSAINTINIPSNIKEIYAGAFMDCTFLTSVTGMEGLETIHDDAFYNTSIVSFNVTSSVKEISSYAFRGGKFLEYVVSDDNVYLTSVDGVLYNKSKTVLYSFPSEKDLTSYTVEETTISVVEYAFGDNQTLKSITFSPNTNTLADNLIKDTLVNEVVILSSDVQLSSRALTTTQELTIKAHIASNAYLYALENEMNFISLCTPVAYSSDDGKTKYIKSTDCDAIILEITVPEETSYTAGIISPAIFNPWGLVYTITYTDMESNTVEPINVGKYIATITYESTSITLEYEITKATPELTAPVALNHQYNWQVQNLITAGNTTGGTLEYKLDGGEWSTQIPKAKDPGDYLVWYRVVGNESYNGIEEAFVNASILKAVINATAPTPITGLVYDGQSHFLVEPGTTNIGIMSYNIDGGYWGFSLPKVINAGTYEVGYKVEIEGYETYGPYTLTIVVSKAVATLTAPTVKSELVYNGEEQDLVNAGSTTGGTLEYRVNNYPWTTEIASATLPDTYTVWYRVIGGINYYDIPASNFEVTIDKATPVVTAPVAKDLTYNGKVQELVEAGTSDVGVINYSLDNETWSENIPSAINANTYTVWYKLVINEYYYPVGPLSVEVEIKKADPIYTAPRARELVFNNDTQELIIPGNSMYGTFEYKLEDGEWDVSLPIALDIGTYTVWYRLNAIENYKDVEATSIEVTIDKTTPHVIAPTPKTLSYTGSEQVLVNEGTTTLGEIEYSFDEITWSTSLPTKKDAGEYIVWYRVEETANYNGIGPVSMTVIINKITLTITADNKEMDERDEYPTFTYKVEGLVGNDTLITEPTITIDKNDAKNKAGEYGLVIANANAGKNYDIVYVNAKLVVHNKISTGEVFIIIGSIVGTISIAAAAFFIFKFKKNRILINRA